MNEMEIVKIFRSWYWAFKLQVLLRKYWRSLKGTSRLPRAFRPLATATQGLMGKSDEI
jgi:hypothetical protein